jgi:hypothetical protein
VAEEGVVEVFLLAVGLDPIIVGVAVVHLLADPPLSIPPLVEEAPIAKPQILSQLLGAILLGVKAILQLKIPVLLPSPVLKNKVLLKQQAHLLLQRLPLLPLLPYLHLESLLGVLVLVSHKNLK